MDPSLTSKVLVMTMRFQGSEGYDLIDYKDNTFAIYKHETWFEDISRSALAITQFFGKRVNSGTASEYLELIHADIIVNYSGEF